MVTISVRIPDDLQKGIKNLVKLGVVENNGTAIRQAIKNYLEMQAVNAVLQAKEEPSLKGKIDDLAKKI